jgi:pSer/pThr/pTyr-binding forkhead associated (FHA) protein
VMDLGSAHGTFVQGSRLAKVSRQQCQQLIAVGGTTLTLLFSRKECEGCIC